MTSKGKEQLLRNLSAASKFGDHHCHEQGNVNIRQKPEGIIQKDERTKPPFISISNPDITFSHRQELLDEISAGSHRNESIEHYIRIKREENTYYRRTVQKKNAGRKDKNTVRVKSEDEKLRNIRKNVLLNNEDSYKILTKRNVAKLTRQMKMLNKNTDDNASTSANSSSDDSIYYDCKSIISDGGSSSSSSRKFTHSISKRRVLSTASSSYSRKSKATNESASTNDSGKPFSHGKDKYNCFLSVGAPTKKFKFNISDFPLVGELKKSS